MSDRTQMTERERAQDYADRVAACKERRRKAVKQRGLSLVQWGILQLAESYDQLKRHAVKEERDNDDHTEE